MGTVANSQQALLKQRFQEGWLTQCSLASYCAQDKAMIFSADEAVHSKLRRNIEQITKAAALKHATNIDDTVETDSTLYSHRDQHHR